VDPFTAIAALRAAYSGIQYCCEALSDGKVEVQRVKQALDDAKTIVADVKGIWATIRGFFKPKVIVETKKDVYVDHIPDEDEVKQQFIKHLGDFFKNHRALVEYTEKRYEEVFNSPDPDQTQILELTTLQAEVDGAYMQLSEMMRVRAPRQLGPLWTRFNLMNQKVSAERAARKERERIKRQQDAWLQEKNHQDRVELALGVFVTIILVTEVWAIWIELFTEG
jgi:hypothetical protein